MTESSPPQRVTDLQVGRVVSMPFDENTYVAYFPGQRECIVFDPGLEPRLILDFPGESNAELIETLNLVSDQLENLDSLAIVKLSSSIL